MREYSVRVPVAGHSESPATTTAREFVPGLRATTTIGYAPDEHPLPSPPERALESQVPALQATPVMLATAPDAQHVQGVPASGMQHESSGEDPLSNGGPALPATPLAAKAPGSTRISISAAAVERLHAEERKTSELNSQLDQLAARLADHKH